MAYSNYVKQRILGLRRCGKSLSKIAETLAAEGHYVTRAGIGGFLKTFQETGSAVRRPGTGGKQKVTADVLDCIDSHLEKNDEATLADLQLDVHQRGVDVSHSTIHRSKAKLGWTSKGTKYCQMIRAANVEKRLDWARGNAGTIDFDRLVFSDETTVQLENHRRTTSYKKGRKPRYKPRPKHPIKVHVWAGISARGSTPAYIFEGKMDAVVFIGILKETFVPFAKEVYPDGCFLVQDNDPKHCSKKAAEFYKEQNINWFKTPAESPDLNAIENVWHELKEHIRRKAKPRTKQELIDGIKAFWSTVDPDKCKKYIYHIRKVIPAVIECEGKATGF